MSKKIEIPKTERKSARVTVRFKSSEKKILDEFCIKKEVTITDLIRFSLQKIIDLKS